MWWWCDGGGDGGGAFGGGRAGSIGCFGLVCELQILYSLLVVVFGWFCGDGCGGGVMVVVMVVVFFFGGVELAVLVALDDCVNCNFCIHY